jgi:hypothetical protein
LAYGDRHLFRDHGDVAPSVIGAEHVAPLDDEEDVPETAYIPCARVTRGDSDVMVELRDTTDGHRALLTFTSLQQLVDGCGDGQPWVAVKGEQIEDIKARSGADVVLWDAALPAEERRTRFQQGD